MHSWGERGRKGRECKFQSTRFMVYPKLVKPYIWSDLLTNQKHIFFTEGCRTVAGPSSGKKCIFPFTHNRKTYYACTRDSASATRHQYPWCSTKVDADGNHIGNGQVWYLHDEITYSSTLSDVYFSFDRAIGETAAQNAQLRVDTRYPLPVKSDA